MKNISTTNRFLLNNENSSILNEFGNESYTSILEKKNVREIRIKKRKMLSKIKYSLQQNK